MRCTTIVQRSQRLPSVETVYDADSTTITKNNNKMKILFHRQIFHTPKKTTSKNNVSNDQKNKSYNHSVSFDHDPSFMEFHKGVTSINGLLHEKQKSTNHRWFVSCRWFDSSSKSIKAPMSSDDPMSQMWTKSAMNQRHESSSSSLSSQTFLRRNDR